MGFHDEKQIRCAIEAKWETSEDFYLVPYYRKSSALGKGPVTRFILAFKENDSSAKALAQQLIIECLKALESELRDKRGCRYIVCVPGHSKGFGSKAGNAMCQALAGKFPWLTFLRHALERTEAVPKAAFAKPGQRVGYEKHLKTINYNDNVLRKTDKSFIMFDDVYTTGDTSNACREIIKKTTQCKRVVGLFLSRTKR